MNLPSDAAVTATPPTAAAPAFTSSMTVYDSLGTASSVEVTWAKTGTNTWTASFGQPKLASDPTKTTAAPITDTV
ncbi:flagellar basal body FlgE domain-containing protein, partial [Mycobacterium avium]|uniref:flagellar basal body FlgE domain-containing protein n=2 Tax=Bacteria TaxID=2 RepID=UPI0034D76415